MKTRKQLRLWLHRYMVEVDNTETNHQKIARVAGKCAARHGLGGDFLLRQVNTPTETVALLADILQALGTDDSGPFTVEEVAEHWGVSVRTIGDLVRQGRLGCFRLGNRIRVSAEHLAEYERHAPTLRHRHL